MNGQHKDTKGTPFEKASKELGIAAVIEEELQVFSVEAKLREALANVVRYGTGRR